MKVLVAFLFMVSVAFGQMSTYQMTSYTDASVIITEKGVGMLSFTGTVTPDITGVRFIESGVHGQKPYYHANIDGEDWFVWWDESDDNWILNQDVSEPTETPLWVRDNLSPVGAFTADTGATGTATSAVDGQLVFDNRNLFPWRISSIEIVQAQTITTNTVSVSVARVVGGEEPWEQFESNVLSVGQTANSAIYSTNTDPSIPANVYVDVDNAVVIRYNTLDGTIFRINGMK